MDCCCSQQKKEQLSEEISNKKTDIKKTPPQEANVPKLPSQDPLTVPLPNSPTSSIRKDSEEGNLIAAIQNSILGTKGNLILDDIEFPPLSPPKITSKAESELPGVNYDGEENSSQKSHFVTTFPENFPPDWSLSPANHYIKPTSEELDAADSSLLPENERRTSLCLHPFSKEFFIATGYSKLQLPEDYLELGRVIIWQNRQRLKMGLEVEFEEFLHEELSQDFSNLGIDIKDLVADLIKIRHAETQAFQTYNNYIKASTNATLPTLSEIKLSPMKNNPDTAAILIKETKPPT